MQPTTQSALRMVKKNYPCNYELSVPGMTPSCFSPSRQFVPRPWRGRPLPLPPLIRFLVLLPFAFAALALLLPFVVFILSALFAR